MSMKPWQLPQLMLWDKKPVPRGWGTQRGDSWVHFVAEGNSFWEQFKNFFCAVMDVFIHKSLWKGCARMRTRKTLYYLSCVYSPADFTLTGLPFAGKNEWCKGMTRSIEKNRKKKKRTRKWRKLSKTTEWDMMKQVTQQSRGMLQKTTWAGEESKKLLAEA